MGRSYHPPAGDRRVAPRCGVTLDSRGRASNARMCTDEEIRCSDVASARRRRPPRSNARKSVVRCSPGWPSDPSRSAHSWAWPTTGPDSSTASAPITAALRSVIRPSSPPSSRRRSARSAATATARATFAVSSSSPPKSSRRCVGPVRLQRRARPPCHPRLQPRPSTGADPHPASSPAGRRRSGGRIPGVRRRPRSGGQRDPDALGDAAGYRVTGPVGLRLGDRDGQPVVARQPHAGADPGDRGLVRVLRGLGRVPTRTRSTNSTTGTSWAPGPSLSTSSRSHRSSRASGTTATCTGSPVTAISAGSPTVRRRPATSGSGLSF